MTRWVVVGAGTAGVVVAARLAARPDNEVVLLEDGPGDPPDVRGDSFFESLATPGRVDDRLVAVRVDGGPVAPYPRGRGLGGSGAVNAMVALSGGPFRAAHRLHSETADPAELGPVDRALLAAAPDATPVPLTRRDGRRVDVTDCYPLDDVDVRGDSRVDRVLLDDRRAVGVRTADGAEIPADRVVVSAGAIESPAVLLRSGVDVAGVGEGLKDHPSAPITLVLRADAVADPSSLAVATMLRRGPLQVLPLNHLGPAAPGLGLLMPALMQVRSEGRVALTDHDPRSRPDVRFSMLSDPADVSGLVDAVEIAVGLLAREPFQEIVAAAHVDRDGTEVAALDSRDAIADWVRTHVGDYVHASCTCRIGVVVDAACRVRDHEGLYVCDASVFPDIPEVNTNLPTVMLAETMVARWLRPG